MQPDSPTSLSGRRSRRRGTVVAALAGVSALALIGVLTLANGGGAPSAEPPAAGNATPGRLPGGGFGRFRIEESSIMAPELAAKFPTLHTYSAQGLDDPSAGGRFD